MIFVHRALVLGACWGVALAASPIPGRAQAPTPPANSGYHLAATWPIAGDGGWDYLIMDSAAHRLYVTRTDRVQAIDTEKGALVGEVPGIEDGHGVALAPELHRGFASSGRSNTVVIFDLPTLQQIGEPVPVGRKPDAIIYDPLTQHVFVCDGGSDNASVLDAATGRALATIPLGGTPEFAVSDGQGTIFVNLEDKSETLAIDARKNVVVQRWPLAPGESPTGLALDPAKHRLFVGCANEKMIVLDATEGRVLGQPAIGKGVDATAFDPGTGYALASCGSGTLTIVQEAGGEFPVVEHLATRPGARTMALDPATHDVYLATANFEPAPPAAGTPRVRPKMVPGSFVILKFVR